MTRKHYILIAQALNAAKPNQPEHVSVWKRTVNQVAQSLRQANQNFNETRFVQACEG